MANSEVFKHVCIEHRLQQFLELVCTKFCKPVFTNYALGVTDKHDVRKALHHKPLSRKVFVEVARASPENLERLSENGYLERLVKEMDKNDVLVQLNALEVLTDLVSCNHGLDYLERTGIISKLRQKALNIGSDPLGNFLGPGDRMSRYLKTLRQNLHSGKVDFKARYLGALANVLHVQDSSYEDLVNLTERWYSLLGDRPTDMLLRLCRQPFPELRCATLSVIAEVARVPWGQATLAAQPGFLEYLLDRSTEADKACKEAKFAVVAILAQVQPRGFSAEDWQRIRNTYQEGPFFMATEAAVTFEGLS
ncbi:hypothetical protein HPB51_008765 [Rhipicephalus microplus]|uniref:26S proteasome non-ATPase regulatory subunit 5 n=1 Tax=Rhipicephalus microplus TaxID=6941 RepID=A0A9J6EG73_RHIMP|nr:hypothetical protein HPB51_008765 [Rhipicephalus microplus]